MTHELNLICTGFGERRHCIVSQLFKKKASYILCVSKTFENFGDSILTAHSMHGIGEVREKTQKSEKRWRSRGRKSEFTQSGKILASLHFVLDLQWQHKVGKTLGMATFQFVWNLHWKHWKLWKHWKHRHLALLNSNWSLFFPVRCRKECTVPNKEEECTVLNKEEECTVLNSKCSADAIDQSPPDHNALETDAIYCSNKDCTVDIAL